jgi:hypothetical protein
VWLLVEDGQVVDRTDGVTTRRQRAPDAVPLGDVLEADELPTDAVESRLIDEHAASNRDAGTVVFGTVLGSGFGF